MYGLTEHACTHKRRKPWQESRPLNLVCALGSRKEAPPSLSLALGIFERLPPVPSWAKTLQADFCLEN